MAISTGSLVNNNFIGGLVTDYDELNTPQNVSVDEDNCDLNKRGFRTRRKGMIFEEDGVASDDNITDDHYTSDYFKTYLWENVDNNGALTFLVVQSGSTLYFYDRDTDVLSVDGLKDFTVDLGTFIAPAATSTSLDGIQVASGKGALFVVGVAITPFYITYDPDTDDITTTQIDIRIRDFAEQDVTDANDAVLSSITDARKYDLYNQGWGTLDTPSQDTRTANNGGYTAVLGYYVGRTGNYPPKTKPWWIGKHANPNTAQIVFNPTEYDTVYGGNTLAALGHFILDPFNKDRATASGITGLTTQVKTNRPSAVAFAAGRVFYGFENQIFFSQVITDDLNVASKCYQDADPTAENINDLVQTDGGVILVSGSGNIVSLFAVENSVLSFANNGVWAVGGKSVGEGFSADSFSVSSTSNIGVLTSRTIVNIEGLPCWWGNNGIFILTPNQLKTGFDVKNLCEKKIQVLYDTINIINKNNASGTYDRLKKRLVWTFNDSDSPSETDNRFLYSRILNFDLVTGAFFPYTISENNVDGATSPFIVDVFSILNPQGIFVSGDAEVIDEGVEVVDIDGDEIIVSGRFPVLPSFSTSTNRFLCLVHSDTDTNSFMFSQLTNGDLADWELGSAGVPYSSYLDAYWQIVGDTTFYMYSPYIYVHTSNEADTDSSLFLQSKWDWAVSTQSKKFGPLQQVYKQRNGYSVAITKNKIRGRGRAIQLKFSSEDNKDFNLLGWGIWYDKETNP